MPMRNDNRDGRGKGREGGEVGALRLPWGPMQKNNRDGRGKGMRGGEAGALRLPAQPGITNSNHTDKINVCVPITGFPITGGTRAVLASIDAVTKDIWQLEYLTQRVGPEPGGFIISRFGASFMSPWQFPLVWLYFLAGLRKLLSLLRHGADYRLILPQDGVFTAAFAGVAGKIMGVRVVCIDHGNLTLLKSRTYRTERNQALAAKSWPRRLLERLLLLAYWPSLYMLAAIAAHTVDYYMVPGVEGDGVETICAQLGIPRDRVMRFASMIDVAAYPRLSAAERASLLEKADLPPDALVVAIVCRLSPEKGIEIALKAIEQALAWIAPEKRAQVRIVIAGAGPLESQVRHLLNSSGLDQNCVMWGELPSAGVKSLLGISDIFLYTSIRGACISMAVLEAMASGCAVIASTQPLSNRYLLAEGRGIAVPPGDVEAAAKALLRLLQEPHLSRRMGTLAREYVAMQHSPASFRKALLQAAGGIIGSEDTSAEEGADMNAGPYEMEHAQ
ncbi:MAG TPA: glycosyltransferase family 4 protein [Ktedonobacteraceae bacterium]|nr:glycosyltransferase family 4 protein [Ktedonobacteraceae bacterium]